MTNLSPFTADHNGFFLNGDSFYPLIQDGTEPLADWSNTVLVRLPAHLSDDLDWSKEKALAAQMIEAGKYLFWEIDLGLCSFQFTPEDSAAFYSFSLAIEEFSKQLWPLFQNHTFGASLYRGSFQPLQSFPMSQWETAFSEWKGEHGQANYELYCAQALSEYLHRLVSFLPDAVQPFALIDASEFMSASKMSQFFSKARFEHLNLAIRGAKIPFSGICWEGGESAQGWLGTHPQTSQVHVVPTVGVCLPNDACMLPAVVQRFDSLISDLKEQKTLFRIVPEEKLTEQWDGLDNLIVLSSALSPQGKRKLLGFAAAGGTVLTIGELIGVPEERLYLSDLAQLSK